MGKRDGDGAAAVAEAEVVLEGLAGLIQKHLDGKVDEKRVREIAEDLIANRLPRPIEVHLDDGRKVQVEGRVHKAFEALMQFVNEGHRNMLMVGPAGSGKTTLAKQVAEALGLQFGFISLSAGVTETHLLGRILPQADGAWAYQASRFVEVYEQGGLFLLDEIDAADANVMVSINAALANGVLANPASGKIHKRHPQCYILGAAISSTSVGTRWTRRRSTGSSWPRPSSTTARTWSWTWPAAPVPTRRPRNSWAGSMGFGRPSSTRGFAGWRRPDWCLTRRQRCGRAPNSPT
jgi:hypothetical protein